jgi:hypothetical protein
MVRILNLLAIDTCMKDTKDYEVKEVRLLQFLSLFNRENAKLSDIFSEERNRISNNDNTNEMLPVFQNGYECFTHFIYLSEKTLISPKLLQYAYRRTAAIVPETGRKGIDWIIPVRIKDGKDGDNKFLGLVGQDKNRVNDSLASLRDVGNDETHGKLSP